MSSVQTWDIDIEEAHEYIKNIQLAPMSAEGSKAFTHAMRNANSVAFVNRGSIQYLPIPAQSTSDALNWTLFGQLAADAVIDREADPIAWYHEYVNTLGRIGMRVNGWHRHNASGADAGTSVNSTALKFLKPFLSPGAQTQIDNIINSLRQAANSNPLTIFNKSSSSLTSGNFQISDGTVDSGLNLTIHAGFMDFKTNQTIQNFLFFNWTNRNFTLYYGSDSMTLAKNLADSLRNAILARIADQIIGNIDDIQLA